MGKGQLVKIFFDSFDCLKDCIEIFFKNIVIYVVSFQIFIFVDSNDLFLVISIIFCYEMNQYIYYVVQRMNGGMNGVF